MAFIIPLLSGLSTMIGFFIIFINKEYKNTIIPASLIFAGIIMISISFFDLIKESLTVFNSYFNMAIIAVTLFFGIGIIISNYFEKIFTKISNKLYRLGILSMICIIIHNIPEGMITYLSYITNTNLGISIAIAIALHNIPEGIIISVPIYYSTNSKFKTFIYIFIASISEFIGAIIAFLLEPYIENYMLGILLGITAGIMFQIACFELLPAAYKYDKKIFYIMIVLSILFSIIFII